MKVDNSMASAMYANAANAYKANNSAEKTDTKINNNEPAKYSNNGNTIGDVKLSEAGAKYYDQLRKKYGDMDFVLVSDDEVDNVEAKASKYANGDRTLVVIDAKTVEKMASDENYRNRYEGIIDNARTSLDEMKSKISGSGAEVKSYGIRINDDGTASYFAVLKKSSEAQKARIEKKNAEKKEQRAEEKKAQGAKFKEKLEEAKSKKNDDEITISAGSIEELIKKVGDYALNQKADNVYTEEEKLLGQSIDFRG